VPSSLKRGVFQTNSYRKYAGSDATRFLSKSTSAICMREEAPQIARRARSGIIENSEVLYTCEARMEDQDQTVSDGNIVA
jgi:hypothetical protein